MNCLLTGSTGILGSHILFEWLRDNIEAKSKAHIYLLIRDNDKSAQERLLYLLQHTSRPAYLDAFELEEMLERITVISSDLASVTPEILAQYPYELVLHCAGSTSLLPTESAREEVFEQNYNFTKHLLESIPNYVQRFAYISTAFSFGIQTEKVNEEVDYEEVRAFRNPYEQSKYECEKLVKTVCEERGIAFQMLRPSIICGRLLDSPFFETPKFDVFYTWPIFLQKFSSRCKEQFRIWIDRKGGLNIVPVDFAAKAILYALAHPELKALNIVNPQRVFHLDYATSILKHFGIQQFEYVDERPTDLNKFETLYYKTVGLLFEKYISVPDLQFDSSLIQEVMDKLNIGTSLMVGQNFMNLVEYAIEKDFRKL